MEGRKHISKSTEKMSKLVESGSPHIQRHGFFHFSDLARRFVRAPKTTPRRAPHDDFVPDTGPLTIAQIAKSHAESESAAFLVEHIRIPILPRHWKLSRNSTRPTFCRLYARSPRFQR
jgi:hypothetical protein